MSAQIYTIESVINQIPAFTLIRISRRVCPDYSAIIHYENRQYPQYFHNQETLREAITEAWEVGDWKQKKQIIMAIEAAGF